MKGHQMIAFGKKIDSFGPHFPILLLLLFPWSTSLGEILAVLLVVVWMAQGGFQDKLSRIASNHFALMAIAFFLWHVMGLLWTEDLDRGLSMTSKALNFLLIPITLTLAPREHLPRAILAFVASMSILGIIIIVKVLSGLPPSLRTISHAPFLAFAVYLAATYYRDGTGLSRTGKSLLVLAGLIMTAALFATTGRAGHLLFFALFSLFIFQIFKRKALFAAFAAMILGAVLFAGMYQISDPFRLRLNQAVSDVRNYQKQEATSVGLRIWFTLNTMEIIRQHPWLGVGTGDYFTEYAKVNQVRSPGLANTTNAHNMYLQVWAQLGLAGLLLMLALFHFQIMAALRTADPLARHVGIAFPLSYLLLMFSDTYLMGHFTLLFFVVFSAYLPVGMGKDKEPARPSGLNPAGDNQAPAR